MRLFLGIEIPDVIKKSLAAYIAKLPHGKKGWEDPHDFHLTMLFIGETSEENVKNIVERMEKIKFSPFTIQIGPLEFFNRRVLYLSVLPSNELIKLRREVMMNYPEWVDPSAKEFIPHITVKRWQRYEYNELAEGIRSHPMDPVPLTVKELVLFKSEKDESNRKYHVIYRQI